MIVIDVTDSLGLVAVRQNGQTDVIRLPGSKHAATLAPALNDMPKACFDAVGVVTGPGSFTGIRIGIATALGLRAALGVPLFALSRFDLMWRAAGCPAEPVLLVIPQRNDSFLVESRSGVLTRRQVSDLTEFPSDWNRIVETDERIREQCLDVFTREIEAGSLDQVGAVSPCYVKPPDAVKGKTVLDQLLDPR